MITTEDRQTEKENLLNEASENDVNTSPNGKTAKKVKEKKKKSRFFKPFITLIILAFCVFAVYDIVIQQAEIEQLKKETAEMSEKITEAKQLNDEYTGLLESDEEEYMKRVAVEQLGYAYPNERRFYIVNGSED